MKLIDMLNASLPPYGIAATGIGIGVNAKDGNGWTVALYSLLCIFCICITMTRILEKGKNND